MKLLAFGEILYDMIEGKPHMGGAPFNLAAHAAKLGAESYLISALGNDPLGKSVIVRANRLNVNTTMVNILENKKTGIVNVSLNKQGNPVYEIREDAAWDSISLSNESLTKLSAIEWDYFCFGSLAQRTENNRTQLSKIFKTGKFKKVFFDINLRLNFYNEQIIRDSFTLADIVKQNDEEVLEVSKMLGIQFHSIEEYGKWLIDQYSIETLVITLGSKGAKVITKEASRSISGVSISVADTVGAGDSFSAAYLVELHKTNDPYKAARMGCKLGAIVASKHGAIPEYNTQTLLNGL
ncbi:MAG: carbohydrate kinase [Salinivirgaceae bacterium]